MAMMVEKHNWLLDLIQTRRRITFAEISHEWQNSSINDSKMPLSYRTFNRYVGEIKKIYGTSIVCDRRTNEFYVSDDGEDGSIKSWLLETIATENLIRECKSINDRILFEPVPRGRENLKPILAAIKGNLILKMTYRTFWNPEAYTTTIEPYFLKSYKQRWYLIGISERHPGQLRVYGLDRMEAIVVTEEHFKYPKDFSPEEYCGKSFGIFLSDRNAETVKIKVIENQQSFLRSLPLHHSQEEIETTPEYSIFQYRLAPEYDFEQELLSRGGTVEVLEPIWLRNEMKSLIEKMYIKYRT